ncbi:hypothetical protein GTW51_15915 [Aurantimonas aggregata]|uniref:Uncharacterized protein n=1 Tax=Aurantimonas aggregata TaxID=2047720 RepID=A0A6L9MKV4_9HYPH|nr:hypothetical protein [Aurantimonas aggregata]NDV88188.1 hypothetical protein [Aurantimonas aggregata]
MSSAALTPSDTRSLRKLAEARADLHLSGMDHHLNEPAAKAAVDAVETSAAALTEALGRAAELGIPMEIEILPPDHSTGRREIVARIVRSETGRRPEDLNSSNDD